MKKLSLMLSMLLVGMLAVAQDHTTDPNKYYLTADEVVNSLVMLPAPPEAGSARMAYDRERYEWGKSVRDTPRGKQAIIDADLSEGWLDRTFSKAFGMKLTKENAPEIYKLINNMKEDAGDLATRDAKVKYMRPRPFMMYNEPSLTPNDEPGLRNNGSYPSGHTSIGWATAIVLSEIHPARAKEIMKRGYEMGESRVICGAHHQSDVDAGRVTGSAVVGLLHANPGFQKQLAKAKTEFAAKSN